MFMSNDFTQSNEYQKLLKQIKFNKKSITIPKETLECMGNHFSIICQLDEDEKLRYEYLGMYKLLQDIYKTYKNTQNKI